MFTIDKMFILPDCGTLLAFADVCVSDVLVIKGVRLLSGKKGMFVSMPQEQGKDSKWYDQVVCKTAAVYEELSDLVIQEYARKTNRALND